MDFDDKIALVTGAGSGIGRETALHLARNGAHVALASRTMSELEGVAREIEQMGRQAPIYQLDISDVAAMAAMFSDLDRRFGRLDIVFANAGINGVWAPIDELQPDEWDKTITINLRGTYLTLHHAVPLMKQSGGAIVINSSINGTRTFTTAGASAYSTTKAGLLALGQMAALELARHRIRVNVICPGAIGTQISDNTVQRNTEAARIPSQFPEGRVPLTGGKPGDVGQVAELVGFLVSERAGHISGTPIWIDGAQSLLV